MVVIITIYLLLLRVLHFWIYFLNWRTTIYLQYTRVLKVSPSLVSCLSAVTKIRVSQVCHFECDYYDSCYTSQVKYVFWLEENASCVVGENSLTLWGNNNLNFRLARDQLGLLETAANLWASRSKAKDFSAVFFSSFESGGITKHLMTGLGETKLTVSLGPVIKVIPKYCIAHPYCA